MFAAGDVRQRSVKCFTSAVGEGSIAATNVSQHRQEPGNWLSEGMRSEKGALVGQSSGTGCAVTRDAHADSALLAETPPCGRGPRPTSLDGSTPESRLLGVPAPFSMANRQVVDLSRGYELADGGALGVPWDPRCMDSVGILLQTPIFRDLSVQDVEELLPDLRERRYAGASRSGSRATAPVMIVLAEGQLKAHRVSRDGREVIVELFRGSRSPARWGCSTRSASGG